MWRLFLVFAVGCVDVSTEVNVAPSAHDDVDVIAEAVDFLNEAAGMDVYSVRMVDHEHRVNGEIIVRAVDGPLHPDGRRGTCQQTAKGVIVRLQVGFSALAAAHELGHAAGLGHHSDRRNLMFIGATKWELTSGQLAALRRAGWEQ